MSNSEEAEAQGTLDLYYFDAPPSQLVYTHLPDAEAHQLLATPVMAAEFETFPLIGRGFFSRFGLRIVSHFKSPIKLVRHTFNPYFESIYSMTISVTCQLQSIKKKRRMCLQKNETGVDVIKLSYPKRLSDRLHFSQKLTFANGQESLPDSDTKLTSFSTLLLFVKIR